jgi:structural maintenance of chromosome 2
MISLSVVSLLFLTSSFTLQAVEKEIKKEGNSSEKLMQKKDALSKKVTDIASQISKLHFSSTEFENLEQSMSSLQTTVTELSERVDTLQAQLSGRLGFEYSDPVRGFDRSKVKGLVAKLIEVQDSKHATALEVVAGGKLFQVVVDEAITGKALLDRGKLKKRVTIIPLDKIQPRHVGANACQRAHQIATSLKATASPAIELVGFEEEVRSAIEYVFGSSIVVDGMKAANEICDITKTRTVTLEGDVYDPSGTISGGSSSQLGTTLVRLTELSDALKKLQLKKPELDQVLKKIKALKADAASFDKLNTQFEVAQAELNAAEKHLSQTNFGMLVEKRDSFIAAHEAAEQEIVLMTQEKDEKWKLYQTLLEKETELTKQRENRLSDIEKSVKAAKILAAQTTLLAREATSRAQTLSLELESLQSELKAAKEVVLLAEQAFLSATNDESESQMEVGETSAKYEEVRQELDSLEQKMSNCTAGLSDLKRTKSDFVKAAEAAKLESKKLSVNVTRIRKDRSLAEKAVTSMLKTYSWIESEMSAFGVCGGDYDFDASDAKEVAQHLKMLKSEQDSLVSAHGCYYVNKNVFVRRNTHLISCSVKEDQ